MKKYFVDFDNTLCRTHNKDYINSTPIIERIEYVNNLKLQGNRITIWTGRGSISGIDYRDLTETQLKEWNVMYDDLILGKPDYDIYLDDKSFNIDTIFPIPDIISCNGNNSSLKSKKETTENVEKGWGKEIIFVNTAEYCGKILCFNKGKRFSMHFHIQKKETWYVAKGKFILVWIEPKSGVKYSEYLNVGDVITNERGEPHQLIALENGEVFEVSTTHFDDDSYRVWKGD